MKKAVIIFFFVVMAMAVPVQKADAQIIDIIKAAVTKVIKAVDLQIQRLQTRTIWLQNAQKVIENTMSKLHLSEISGWVQKQKDLYGNYYDELWKVKAIITYYHRIREISDRQVQLVTEYKRAWNLLKGDSHFRPDEIKYMGQVYEGILSATVQDIDALVMVLNSFSTQMSDAKRMEIINTTAAETERHYGDLKEFNTQNALLSLSRTKDAQEIDVVKKMYGL